jgi:hypothetical protein
VIDFHGEPEQSLKDVYLFRNQSEAIIFFANKNVNLNVLKIHCNER